MGKHTQKVSAPAASTFLSSSKRPRSQTSGGFGSSSARHCGKDDIQKKTCRNAPYEDYEQIPASPWSQSPAPSPAVQVDPDVNPFFAQAAIDEDAFAEDPPLHDYTADQDIAAIGVDSASSVIHLPLMHPLLSQSKGSQRLQAESRNMGLGDAEEQFSSASWKLTAQSSLMPENNNKRTPIAILSILSPSVPYPSSLTISLGDLAPHLATSFYNARQHSSLQKDVVGLSRHRCDHKGGTVLRMPLQRNGGVRAAGSTIAVALDEYFASPNTGSTFGSSEYSGYSSQSPRYSSASNSQMGTPAETVFVGQQRPNLSKPGVIDSHFSYSSPAKCVPAEDEKEINQSEYIESHLIQSEVGNDTDGAMWNAIGETSKYGFRRGRRPDRDKKTIDAKQRRARCL
ncbi:hypothetical protein MMC06_001528 [Schaereria dolodes]|nr:hypothetical protein [Schaereria dolodes]